MTRGDGIQNRLGREKRGDENRLEREEMGTRMDWDERK